MTLTVAGLVVAVVVAVLTAAGIAAGAVWFLSGRIDTLSGRIDSSRAEMLTQVRQLDEKNESAHAGIVARIDSSRTEALARADAHAAKLDAVAHDVAFLAGRRKERDHQGGGGA